MLHHDIWRRDLGIGRHHSKATKFLTTAYCASFRIFGTLQKKLVSVFAGITFVIWWHLLLWKLKLEVEWNRLCDLLIVCLLLVALTGIYEKSFFLGRPDTIFETHNPAFGGRATRSIRFDQQKSLITDQKNWINQSRSIRVTPRGVTLVGIGGWFRNGIVLLYLFVS